MVVVSDEQTLSPGLICGGSILFEMVSTPIKRLQIINEWMSFIITEVTLKWHLLIRTNTVENS